MITFMLYVLVGLLVVSAIPLFMRTFEYSNKLTRVALNKAKEKIEHRKKDDIDLEIEYEKQVAVELDEKMSKIFELARLKESNKKRRAEIERKSEELEPKGLEFFDD